MASNKAIVLSLALTLICLSDLGLSEGRKWKLENDFQSMSNTGENEAAGDEGGDLSLMRQPRIVRAPAPAPSGKAHFTPSPSPRRHPPRRHPPHRHPRHRHPGVGHPVHPPMSTHGEYNAMTAKEDNEDHGLLKHRPRHPKKPSAPAPAPTGKAISPTSPGHAPRVGHPVHPPMSTDGNYEVTMAQDQEDNDNHGKPKRGHKHSPHAPAPAPTGEKVSPTNPASLKP